MDDRRGALEPPAAPGTVSGRDEAYAYDGLDRLVKAWRGTLSSDKTNPANVPYPGDATRDGTVDFLDYVRVTTNYGQTTSDWERGEMNGDGTVNDLDSDIVSNNYGASPTASLTAAQEWSLEALGNWKGFREDDDSTLDWDVLDQDRLHNKVNEIDDDDDHLPDPIDPDAITEGQGQGQAAWVVPGYDAAGNMLSGPKPGNETVRQHYKWDAWNRLVAVYADDDGEPGDLVATYRYDGLNRRIQKVVEGDPDVTYDYYYNESWQIVEVRKDSDTDPYEQFVWDVRYIDAPVVRFLDGNTDGDLTGGTQEGDNTLYYTNDANMNVTALVDASDGAVVERYMYDPYGKPTVLNGVRDSTGTATTEWNTRLSNTFQNSILYCGYFFDNESGLYHVRHRYYHPTLGRWTSRDPAARGYDTNLLAYCAGSPATHVDPWGMHKLLTPEIDGSAYLDRLNAREREKKSRTITDGITFANPDTLSIRGDYNEETKCCILYGYAEIVTAVRKDLQTEASLLAGVTASNAGSLEASLRNPVTGKGTKAVVSPDTQEAARAHEAIHVQQAKILIKQAFDEVDPHLGQDEGFNTTRAGCESAARVRTPDFQNAYQRVKNNIQRGEEQKWKDYKNKIEDEAMVITKEILGATADKVRARGDELRKE